MREVCLFRSRSLERGFVHTDVKNLIFLTYNARRLLWACNHVVIVNNSSAGERHKNRL